MLVRKIPKHYLVVAGSFASRKNGRMPGFESLLERDCMILPEFDDAIGKFEGQPVAQHREWDFRAVAEQESRPARRARPRRCRARDRRPRRIVIGHDQPLPSLL